LALWGLDQKDKLYNVFFQSNLECGVAERTVQIELRLMGASKKITWEKYC
jgi:hypothetical protein